MLNRNRVIGLVLITVLLLAAAPAVLGAFSPEVFVVDQPVIDDTVNITRATIGEPGHSPVTTACGISESIKTTRSRSTSLSVACNRTCWRT